MNQITSSSTTKVIPTTSTQPPNPTITPSPIPSPTFTPTVVPIPPQPTHVTASVAKVQSQLKERNIVEPICLHQEDTDDDGKCEWTGIYALPEGDTKRLKAFIWDPVDEAWYDLQPMEKEADEKDFGLGEYPTCELEIHDVNNDGETEILIWGHAETSTDLLHIFTWNGSTYTLLSPFEGEAGVYMEDQDGDLNEEIIVSYRVGKGLIWQAVYTWDGASYGWTWEQYDWLYRDRPHFYPADTPVRAVVSFYLALDDRDLPGAYNFLSESAQSAQPYEAWAVGFSTTVAAKVGVVHEIGRDGNTATVTAQVRAYDNKDGRIIITLWDVTWSAIQRETSWQLESVTAVQLDQWEAPYYD